MSTSSAPRTLLVATDGSPPARLATVVAARIAASSDAELTVLHVAAPTRYRVARMALPIPVTRRLDDPLGNAVLTEARRLAYQEGATCTPVLLTGDPPAAIVAFSTRLDAELLVIGAHDHAWFAVARARTARRVQSHAPCPVLVVHAPRTYSRPLPREPRHMPVRRLVVQQPEWTSCRCCSTGGCACCGTSRGRPQAA